MLVDKPAGFDGDDVSAGSAGAGGRPQPGQDILAAQVAVQQQDLDQLSGAGGVAVRGASRSPERLDRAEDPWRRDDRSAYSAGSTVLTLAVNVVIPVAGLAVLPAAAAVNSAINAALTYRLGSECIRRFSDPDLSTRDLLTAGFRMIPSFSELGDLRRLLAGS